MTLRLIEIIIPKDKKNKSQELLKDYSLHGIWFQDLQDEKVRIQALLNVEETEPLIDRLNKHFSTLESFRIILLPVEATIPRIEEKQKEAANGKLNNKTPKRISRDELYSDLADKTYLTEIYIATVILSSIVATIGIIKNNVAVIIGAMVIAPLLGSNVALSLGTTLGDIKLCKNAIVVGTVGTIIALLLSFSIGYFLHVNPYLPEIYTRTNVGLSDIVLALAAGSAGALAFTAGVPSTLVGVMVAVALLPPLVTAGLLIGANYPILAYRAALLFFTNLICINLAGVVTFLIQGIRPATWWETKSAQKATVTAVILWTVLLIVLTAAIRLSRKV